MGQYFKAFILSGNEPITISLSPDSQLIMHAEFNNVLVQSIIGFIHKKGPCRVAWVGDYYEGNVPKTPFKGEDIWKNESEQTVIKPLAINSKLFDYMNTGSPEHAYLINLDQKKFINLYNYPNQEPIIEKRRFSLHPLPLLTALGNGTNVGDYIGKNRKHVGSWAGDLIAVSDSISNAFERMDILFQQ